MTQDLENTRFVFVEENDGLGVIGSGYRRGGVRVGTWRFNNKNASSLIGEVDKDGKLTGPKIAYIYPDRWTALVGHFDDGVMRLAKLARIQKVVNGIPEFELLASSPVYTYDKSTHDKISSDPCLPDPYEQDRVCVKCSAIDGADEGLFSKVDAGPGDVVSFYNGIRLTHKEVDARSWEENSYTMVLDDTQILDVPHALTSTEKYCATLGHKINHSFRPNCNTEPFNHPRFGLIIAVRTNQAIKRGDELTINYGYGDLTYPCEDVDVPNWYQKLITLFSN